ncbi:hypothetical protein MFRU_012g01850 [Monilinia fructicola]|nr:hypothetical protein MFRU_012g01850 [Monilinia fructicola]
MSQSPELSVSFVDAVGAFITPRENIDDPPSTFDMRRRPTLAGSLTRPNIGWRGLAV